MSERNPSSAALLRLNREARRVRLPLAVALGAGTLAGALLIPQAVLLAHLIDQAVFHHVAPATLRIPLALLGTVFAVRALALYASERGGSRAALSVKARMRTELLAHLHRIDPARLAPAGPGELAGTLVDGVEALEGYYARYLPQAALAVIVPLAILTVVFPVDWISALILMGTAPLIPVFMILIGKGAQALNERQWRKLARLSAHFYEVLAGLATLKAFGAGSAQGRQIERLSDQYRTSTMGVLRVAFLSALALEFLATVSIAMVAVLVGFRLLWGEISFAAGLTALLLAPEFYLPLRNIGQSYHSRLSAVAAAEAIDGLLALAPRPAGGNLACARDAGAPGVIFDRVSFAYEPGADVLHEVSFEVPAGCRLAVVGPSGAGKSTVLNLVLGFGSPHAGRILVDGRPLAALALADWRRSLAWVPQRPHMFAGSLADNIRLGRPDAADEAVRAAARAAQAAGFIEALPHGYATPVGEDGANLSGGEVRRIAIARALLRDARLIVLDEPTASLDAESEAAVARALETLTRGRTVITMAHRLRTVRSAERIVVLDRGYVAGIGTHAELLSACDLYRNLVAGSVPE